jgi:hypothetical protein
MQNFSLFSAFCKDRLYFIAVFRSRSFHLYDSTTKKSISLLGKRSSQLGFLTPVLLAGLVALCNSGKASLFLTRLAKSRSPRMENLLGPIIILVIATLVAVRGGNILSEKGRPYWIGFALGFFFSLLGLAVCYLIPATAEVREQRVRMER